MAIVRPKRRRGAVATQSPVKWKPTFEVDYMVNWRLLRRFASRNDIGLLLIIRRALIDPVSDQLQLCRRQLGAAFGHLLR